MHRTKILPIVFFAATAIGVNASPLCAQSQSNKDTSIGGTQSERTDSGAPVKPLPSERSEKGTAGQMKQNDQGTSGTYSGSSSRGVRNRSASSGVNHQDIREAQEALKAQGHDPGPIDGVMGPKTRQALKEFQSSNGLQQTGTLDAQTKDKLNIENSSSSGSNSMGRSSSPMGK